MTTKRKTPTIAQGRLDADIKMTTEEIEYNQDLHRWYVVNGNKEEAKKYREIARKREAHLKELRERDSRN